MYFLFQTGTFNKSVWFIHFMRLKNKVALITGGETGIGKPEDIAYGVLFLASNEADWTTGVILPIDGGFTAR